jgi:hypothetical protein
MADHLGTVTRGDDEVIQLTVKNGDKSVRNITSAGGQIEVTLDNDDLLVLDRERTYPAELEVTDSGGKKATTPFTVNFELDLA